MVGQQAPCSVDVKNYSVSFIDGYSIEVAYKQSKPSSNAGKIPDLAHKKSFY